MILCLSYFLALVYFLYINTDLEEENEHNLSNGIDMISKYEDTSYGYTNNKSAIQNKNTGMLKYMYTNHKIHEIKHSSNTYIYK